MFAIRPSQQRPALTTPEALGVIVCLSIGLVSGFWLFGEDLAQLLNMASTRPNSEVAENRGVPASQRVFQGEVDLQLSERERAQPMEPAESFESEPIDRDQVRALLGERRLSDLRKVRPSGSALTREAHKVFRPTSPADHAAEAEVASGQPSGQSTLNYWNAMNDVMANEETMRAAPIGGVNQANAADFIHRRGRAGTYAADALRKLDTTGVDPDAIKLGGDIANWYEQGTQLNNKADYLLNEADANTRRGQTGQSWANSEKAHQASVEEINRRGDRLQRELSRRYGLSFPDLR